jgi:hypothetical protein
MIIDDTRRRFDVATYFSPSPKTPARCRTSVMEWDFSAKNLGKRTHIHVNLTSFFRRPLTRLEPELHGQRAEHAQNGRVEGVILFAVTQTHIDRRSAARAPSFDKHMLRACALDRDKPHRNLRALSLTIKRGNANAEGMLPRRLL